MLNNKKSPVDSSSDDVDNIMLVSGKYMISLLEYCEAFHSFLNDEAENKCGVALSTELEQYLLQLTSMAEKLVDAVGATQGCLKLWKLRIADREECQLYNLILRLRHRIFPALQTGQS